MDYNSLTVKTIADRVQKGDLKAQDLVAESLKRAKQSQKDLNAFITIDDGAIEKAKEVDAAVKAGKKVGKLAGLPIAVKDLLLTKGVRTTAASKILGNFIPPYSATIVKKLEAAGAIIMGKTNLDEFAMGASNENSAFGPVKNPWDLTRVPGGSSGGSAAVVAARVTPASIGTDTGGSIREPANFCGIVGIKPTYGRVSRFGVVAFASSLDQAGPMCATVEDAALVLEAISGKDPRDSTSADVPVPDWSKNIPSDMKGLKVGLPREYFVEGLDPEVEKSVRSAVDILKSAGAQIVDVSLPMTKYGVAVYYIVAPCEASANLSRYDGVRYGYRSKDAGDLDELYKRSRGEGFGAEPKRRIILGTYALSSGYYDAYYKKACQVRRLIRQDYEKAFSQCDVLVTPVTAAPAFKIGEKSDDPLAMYLNDIYTLTAPLAGIPGMSLNCGYSKSGLPIGVQILASHFQEDKIFRAATIIEKNQKDVRRAPYGA